MPNDPAFDCIVREEGLRAGKMSVDALAHLFDQNGIDLKRGPIFDEAPALPEGGIPFDRFEGMMLGLAIGDALGNTSESLFPGERRRIYGEIRDYLPNRHAGGRRVGLPSDDTQLAFWTLDQMLEDGGKLVPRNVARRFLSSGRIFGMGATMRQFLANYKQVASWSAAGEKSAGNGAIMRIAPVVYPHLNKPGDLLWSDAAILAMITHNDSAAIASCVGFTAILWELLAMKGAPEPAWWVDRFVSVARQIEDDDGYRSRSPHYPDFEGPLWRFVEETVPAAFGQGLSAREACDRWYSGAYMLETMPSAIYILMRHAGDPEEAIVRAVNDTRDNDTVAAIVGAAVGALHGKKALPSRWLEGLLGRTKADDDGKVFEILARARDSFSGIVDAG